MNRTSLCRTSQVLPGQTGKALLLPILFVAAVCALGAASLQTADYVARFAAYGLNVALANNLREAVPGRLYRSGEMSVEQAERVIENYGIKTVIDLRLGNDPVNENGLTEKEVSEALGAEYIHIGFRSTRVSPLVSVQKLLDTFQTAAPPVWIHCTNGTHRSGFASLLWMLAKEGADFETAKAQLSAEFGFLELERMVRTFKAGHPTQDSVVWKYEEEHPEHKPDFIPWLLNEIRDVKPKYHHQPAETSD